MDEESGKYVAEMIVEMISMGATLDEVELACNEYLDDDLYE